LSAARDIMVTPADTRTRAEFDDRLNLDLPADLHELRVRKIEAIRRMN